MLSAKIHTSSTLRVLLILMGVLILAGCGNLREQPKFNKAYDASPTFGSAAREILPETVPIGWLREDTHLYDGLVDGAYADGFPFEITEEVLAEGRRWYEQVCSACHGFSGYGNGVTSAEGYPQPGPASFHLERLVNAPDGYFYDVVTNGRGIMLPYAGRVPLEARWSIVAYIRAMQFSQAAPFDELPGDIQSQISGGA